MSRRKCRPSPASPARRPLFHAFIASAVCITFAAETLAQAPPPPPPPPPPPLPTSPAADVAPAPNPEMVSAPGLAPLSEALSGRAKADYDAARLLYEDRDYAGALVKYKSAYDASKDARLLWNAATCEKNLRHYAKAVTLVNRYLAAGTPYVTPALREQAQVFLDAVRPLTAKASVVTSESDASVYVDNELVGTTPLTEEFLTDIGAHELAVRKDGFKPYTQQVDVSGAERIRIEVILERDLHEGHLVIHAGAKDTIVIDGKGVGSGTWQGTVKSGGHTLRVTAPDMYAYQSEVSIRDGETRRVDVTLEPTSKGVPTWVWLVGSAAVLGGAATAGYFLFKPSDMRTSSTPGSMDPGTIQLPFTRR